MKPGATTNPLASTTVRPAQWSRRNRGDFRAANPDVADAVEARGRVQHAAVRQNHVVFLSPTRHRQKRTR